FNLEPTIQLQDHLLRLLEALTNYEKKLSSIDKNSAFYVNRNNLLKVQYETANKALKPISQMYLGTMMLPSIEACVEQINSSNRVFKTLKSFEEVVQIDKDNILDEKSKNLHAEIYRAACDV